MVKKLKKILLAFAIAIFTAIPAFAQPQAVVLLQEPNQIDQLPQPYENICLALSNGKQDVLKNISFAVAESLTLPEPKILEQLGAAAAKQYGGDPVLGMAKFCGCLDEYTTLEAQVKAAAAFAKGYKSAGVVIVPIDAVEDAPQTKLEILTGKSAYFIPFANGTNFTLSLLGKKGQTAKIWKILGDKPVSKEWEGGFWEREILVRGK